MHSSIFHIYCHSYNQLLAENCWNSLIFYLLLWYELQKWSTSIYCTLFYL